MTYPQRKQFKKPVKIYTQFNIYRANCYFLFWSFSAVELLVMSFDSIREMVVSIFASAGVAGIILII